MDIYPRVFQVAVDIILFVRAFPRTMDANEVGRQLIRAGTSVGANMEEADGAESPRDFVHKVRVSRKEARESRFWLRVCLATQIGDRKRAEELIREADELVRIFSKIISNTEANAR